MKKLLAVLILCSTCLLSCSSVDQVKGKRYVYIDAPKGTHITLNFDIADNRVYGRTPANQYNGAYELDGSDMVFMPFMSTMKSGSETAMKAERDFFTDMSSVVSYSIDDHVLTLKNKNGKKLKFQEVNNNMSQQ